MPNEIEQLKERVAGLEAALHAYEEFDDVIAICSDSRREKYQALMAALDGLREPRE